MSSLVNKLIANKPVFGLLQMGAKAAMRNYATSRGLNWDEHVRRMQSPELATQVNVIFQLSCVRPDPCPLCGCMHHLR